MATQLEIYKMAAAYMKSGATISSTSDNTPVVNALNMFFTFTRDWLLTQDLWRFAIKRVTLSTPTTSPVFGWTYAYTLPNDFLMPVKVIGDEPYLIENGTLVSNAASVQLVYMYQHTTYTAYPNWYAKLLALALAKEAAMVVTQSDTVLGGIEQKFRSDLNEARYVNSLMGYSDNIRIEGLQNVKSTGNIDLSSGVFE